ncbi:MAG: insulinase family protein, partial [Clostridiales bacterium]|nr:insulinase family protein [Clostridiales bacterium]
MKKVLTFCLALVIALHTPVSARAAEVAGLPAVGDEVGGFTVTNRGNFNLVGAETVLFEHNKTGGQVLYIASEDIERSFNIAFKTPKLDSKGVPHVFEHITISGSEKYPSQNLFFPLANRTYNTFVNAMTYDTMTTYPLASLSPEQLLVIADYYLDGVFHPMIYDEERLYRREAWRYELADADSPVTVSGTVYNEMKGNQTIEAAAYYNAIKALFPGSVIANVNGGDPDAILDMTWQDLKDFHTAYYHPSNALVTLYGDLDCEAFLSLVDGYFSEFEKSEVAVETGVIDPLTEPVTEVYRFPVEAGSQTEGASIISYSGAANGATLEDNIGLQFLMLALTHEASPLITDMREKFPGSNVFSMLNLSAAPVSFFTFQGDGLDPGDAEAFKSAVDTALAQIAEDGVAQNIVEALLAADRFSNLTIPESPNLGVNLSTSTSLFWSLGGGLDFYNEYLEALDSIEAKLGDGYMEELLQKYVLNNPHKALVTTSPEAGLTEAKDAELAAELAALKEAMSEDEIAAMVEETASLAAWSMEEAPEELVEKFQVIGVDNLPEEAPSYGINERDGEGVRYMTAEADVADIGSTMLNFDISALAKDEIHYLRLYTDLIGSLGTSNHSLSEISTLMTRYLNGFSASATVLDKKDGYAPVLSVQWMSLNSEYPTGVDLVKELVFNSDTSDTDTVKSVVSRLKTLMRNEINQSPYTYQYTRAMAAHDEAYAYAAYMGGIEYYQFLIEAETALEADPEAFRQKLADAVDRVAVRDNITALFAGNAEGIRAFEENIDAVFEGLKPLGDMPEGYGDDAFKPELLAQNSEALVIDSTVQYNLLYAPLEDIGLEDSGKLQPASTFLYDAYMTPQIRHNIGAYGIIMQLDENG